MKKVLVTGATGFIGRSCLSVLREGEYEIHAVIPGWEQSEAPEQGVVWHKSDLLDSSEVVTLFRNVQPSHLLHLAWYTEPGSVYTSLENFRWVRASLELLENFADNGGVRAVVAGTCAEYDWRCGYFVEGLTPLAPSTVYGACKNALQQLFDSFAAQAKLSGCWGRVFFVYGPHEHPKRLVPSVIRSILMGQPARCSHGRQMRDYLYVHDVADAFVTLLESEVAGPVNIASGKPRALKDIVYRIADAMGERRLVELGAIPPADNDPPLIVADIKRLNDEVLWRPKHSLESGISKTIDWWKQQMEKGAFR